jgi:hypothetical protein
MNKLSFAVVPYLPSAKSFSFAGYQFVRLQDLHDYADGSVLDAANVIAGQYLNQMNQPIQKVTFVFPANKKFGEYFDDTIMVEISGMLQALYLDGFCHMDQLNAVTAENFDALFYEMLPNDYSLSTRSGVVIPQTNMAIPMKETYHVAPSYVIVDRGNFIPSQMVSPALAHVVSKQTPSLLNSLSFFFQAMRNDDRRTRINRTTDLYMAFLMLMKASPDEKERELWWSNLAAISKSGLSKYPYPIIHTQTGKSKPKPENLNIVQIWGEEFYKLRCKLLHGDKLQITDFVFSDISGNKLVPENPDHFYLGANVFPAMFFYKFQQEHLGYPDVPNLIIDDKEDVTSKNYTDLGFGRLNYKLPFYVNDLSLMNAFQRALHPHP